VGHRISSAPFRAAMLQRRPCRDVDFGQDRISLFINVDVSALIPRDRFGSLSEERNLENPFVAAPYVSTPNGREITDGFSSDHEKLLVQDVG